MSEGRFVLRSVKRRKASHGRYGSGIMMTCREKYVHKKLYLLQRDKQLLPLLAMPLQGEKKTSKLNFLMPSLEVVRRAHELLERICGVQQEEKEVLEYELCLAR